MNSKYYFTHSEKVSESNDEYIRHYVIEFFDNNGTLIFEVTRIATKGELLKLTDTIPMEVRDEYIPPVYCFLLSDSLIKSLHGSRMVSELQELLRLASGKKRPVSLAQFLKMTNPFFESIKITRKAEWTVNKAFYKVFHHIGYRPGQEIALCTENLPVFHA